MNYIKYPLALSLALFAAGCDRPNWKTCAPVNTWHAPAHQCAVAVVEPEPEPEPVVEAEPEPAPESNVRVSEDRIEILQKVQFETGSATIRSESFELLDEVAQTIIDTTSIKKIRVEGHTDNVGSASMNRRLSKDRAKSVRTYLVDKGVDASTLDSEGYGLDQPIGDNDTEEGREENRRVEFKIVEREEAEAEDSEE